MKVLKHFFYPYRTSFIIFFGILLYILVLIFDPDPPQFPLPLNSDPIDCQNIEVISIIGEKSRTKFKIKLHEFIQYPKEIITSMIHIITKSSVSVIDYTSDFFWDLESNLTYLNFCILQQIGGILNVSFYCHQNFLKSKIIEVGPIEIFPIGWSRMIFNNELIFQLNNFVLENDSSISFSIQPNTTISNIQLSLNNFIKINPIKKSSENVKNQINNTKHFNQITLFISTNPINLFRQYIDILIPYWGSMFHSYFNIHNILFLNNQTNLTNIFEPFNTINFLYTGNRYSFNDGRFLKAPFKNNNEIEGIYEILNYFFKFKKGLINNLRNLYTKEEILPGRIIVDEINSFLIPILIQKFPNFIIEKIPNFQYINEISRFMSSANIFISSSIFTMIHSIWMKENAILIELPPNLDICPMFYKNFSLIYNIKTIPIFINEKCYCNDFFCHYNSTIISLNNFIKNVVDTITKLNIVL